MVRKAVFVIAGYLLGLGSAELYALWSEKPSILPHLSSDAVAVGAMKADSVAAKAVEAGSLALDSLRMDSLRTAAAASLLRADSLRATGAPAGIDSLAGFPTDSGEVSPLHRAQLVRMFARMKGKDAAPILGALGDVEAATVLAGLPDRKASEILAALVPERAAAISRLAIERKAREP